MRTSHGGPALYSLAATSLLAVTFGVLRAQQRTRLHAGPVPVRYTEGSVHGFLELRSAEGGLLGHGDLLQLPAKGGIESRLVIYFADKSLFDETLTFTQQGVFRMERYHLVQRGPAFGADLDATLSRDGHWEVTSTSHKDGKVERSTGQLELPADVANGLPVVLAKNLRPGDTADVHLVAFTPKPRLIGFRIADAGTVTARLGTRPLTTAHFVLKPRLGALTGFFARLLGKVPPDGQIWIITDQVPAFLRFEGPMYSGPVWRLSPVTPDFPGGTVPPGAP